MALQMVQIYDQHTESASFLRQFRPDWVNFERRKRRGFRPISD